MIGKPWQLAEAEVVEALATRYHYLPSEVLRRATTYDLQHLAIWSIAHPPETPAED